MTIYVAYNPCVQFHEAKYRRSMYLWKIGYTSFSDPQRRLQQQGNTWFPVPFEIVWSIRGGKAVEKQIHAELDRLGLRYSYQNGGTEFFGLPKDFDIEALLSMYVSKKSDWIKKPSLHTYQWSPRK